MAINIQRFNEVVAAAKAKAAGNARWINAIDKAADGILSGACCEKIFLPVMIQINLKRRKETDKW
jgi:hypothetical protein